MVRFTKCLVAVVALGFVVGSACKKADDAKGAGGGAAGGDDVALIPADSEVVVGFNFAQLQQSALWKQYSPKIMDKMSSKLTDFKAACGFDPMEAFKSMTMGMKNVGGAGTKPDGVMVVHGPDKTKMLSCMDKYKAEAAKHGTDITVDGDVILAKDSKDGMTYAMTFVNDTTMVATLGTMGTKDGVKAAAKGGNGLKSSQMFNDLFSKINTNDSLWMMVNGNSPLLDKMGAMIGKPKAIYGSINITDGLAVDFHVKSATADEAKSLVDLAKTQTESPQVKNMVDKIDISNTGDDAHFVVAMGAQKLQSLIGMFGGMMGMMGGGGGGGGMGQ
jgi:hypothetical protein